MSGDDIMKLVLVGLCTVGLGAMSIGGCIAVKELERKKKQKENQGRAI